MTAACLSSIWGRRELGNQSITISLLRTLLLLLTNHESLEQLPSFCNDAAAVTCLPRLRSW